MSCPRALPLLALLLALGAGPLAAGAQGQEVDGGATWRLEQPLPPELPDGQKATTPIGLGKIGDIEFFAPNLGLLTTAGNPPTIPPGIWVYNGVGWHELATECGATDGRIAWAGESEFWTVSDGRPGQASTEGTPPLEDNTLCHFANGQIVGSYASLAFLPTSYQPMQGAACVGPEDCWFGGDPLPAGQVGAFHLHWNGHALSAEPNPQGHAVEEMRSFAGALYESVRLAAGDLLGEEESPSEPSDLHVIEPNGVEPVFESLLPGVPIYSEGEFPDALDFFHLSSDERALWGAADPANPTPEKSASGEVTVIRYAGGAWKQILGPTTDPEAGNPFTKEAGGASGRGNEAVSSIAAEPPSEGEQDAAEEDAWLALESGEEPARDPLAMARVARLSDEGAVSERQTLPTEQELLEGVGPKGAASRVACPAPHDCWLATAQGWLFHLAPEGQRQLPANNDPAFSHLITFRPHDAGIPQVAPDAPPEDDSGLLGEVPVTTGAFTEAVTRSEFRVTVPLLSSLHARLVHGSTLELRFHLAVKARIRLVAERHKKVVASTPTRTFAAGSRQLLLRLNPRRWPTKLALQTHALAPLPTTSTRGAGTDTVSTGLVVLPQKSLLTGLGPLG